MSVIGDVRTGLKANLDSIPGVNVSKYALSNPMGGPLLHLWPTGVTYHRAMTTGIVDATFTVQAVCAVITDQDSQAKIDRMLDGEGADSVFAALEADKTLGGVCDSLTVSEAANITIAVTATNEERMTADWSVTVFF